MNGSSKKLDGPASAKIIHDDTSEILKRWEELSREKVSAARAQSRLALRDSLPQFIEQLVRTLESEDPKQHAEANAEVAKEHGEDRASQEEYNLEQVLYEYHILRSVIIGHLEKHGVLETATSNIIHDFIERGIRKAAVRYTEIEAESQARQKADLEASRQEAERANMAKTAFLANMSHEIRTPLGAIMGFVNLLKDSGVSEQDVSSYLSVVERNSHHLLRIVDDILDLAKVESGKMSVETIEFSLVQFLSEFASFAGLKARENGIAFDFRADTLLPENICSDPTRLRQILSNVVGNAIKFTEKGKVELIVSYIDKHLEFKVTDTGRGISKEQRTHLFQAFAQADSSTTRKFGGTGLGLILTKKLAEALGGDFKLVTSEIGTGSVFLSSVPVKLPEKSTLVPVRVLEFQPPEQFGRPEHADLAGFKVLLVEDSPDNQMLVKLIVQKLGIDLDVAHDGADGVAAALAKPYDVVLMDIQMPNMDGHEAVRTLRSKNFSKPIVALTAHATKEERERAEASGFSHFLTKPINRKSLVNLLEALHTAAVSQRS